MVGFFHCVVLADEEIAQCGTVGWVTTLGDVIDFLDWEILDTVAIDSVVQGSLVSVNAEHDYDWACEQEQEVFR
jgi:hypothetical protein